MGRGLAIVVAGVLSLAGCEAEGVTLSIDLRTDYVPGFDFTGVETTVQIGEAEWAPAATFASADEDYLAGQRVAEVSGLPAGVALVRVSIRNGTGAVLATRLTRVRLERDSGMIVVITRSCESVRCPGTGDDSSVTECLAGRCVEPTCEPTRPETCPSQTCSMDDCRSDVECVRAECAGVACLLAPRDSLCPTGQRCDPSSGCVAVGASDAGMPDGSPADAGSDTAIAPDAAPDAGLDPALVAWFSCDRIDSGRLSDDSGSGHDAQCTACPTISSGRIGNACTFDRASGTGLRIPHHSDFDTTTGFTIAMFVWADPGAGSLFGRPAGSSSANSYQLELRDFGGGMPDSPDTVVFTTTPDGLEWEHIDHYEAIGGRWAHVAATWDGTTKRLYVDGSEVGTAPGDLFLEDADILLGYDDIVGGGASWLFFDGSLDDIRFYSRALAEAEVSALADP